MCELVAFESLFPTEWSLDRGDTIEFQEAATIVGVQPGGGLVAQCWHPETGEWATMLPPVAGMGWQMTPGSKIRTIPAEHAPAPEPSMVEQVEAVT